MDNEVVEPFTITLVTTGFFDASVVRYPSSYSYPGTYATSCLTPVPGYAAGSSTFTAIDIFNTISLDAKYAGGVLGPNGLIYFSEKTKVSEEVCGGIINWRFRG